MPSLETTLVFMAAGLALNLTPGPDMLYVATRSASEGRAAGWASALGIAVGCLFHLAALAFGLTALWTRLPAAYEFVQFAGAAYLTYLGVKALLWPTPLTVAEGVKAASLIVVFRQGVITNILNPKVAFFFLAFLPQFVEPARGNPVAQIVFLGLLFNVSGTLVNGGVAILASKATSWLRAREGAALRLQRLTGLVFVGLGLRLAWSHRD